jgi:SAM-dependent methyltransferase
MDVPAKMQEWDEAVWCLAALAVAWGPSATGQRQAAAERVLEALGGLTPPPGSTAAQLAAQAGAPLLQVAALLSAEAGSWMDLPEHALIAQGEASGQMAAAFERFLLPQLAGLAAALAAPGARMLDVGTGVGAIARGFAGTFPALQVTGIDVAERVLAIGERLLAESPVKDRVTLRQQDVAEVEDVDAYDLVWVPAPFVPSEPLRTGLEQCARALRPGGWLLVGHAKLTAATPLQEALTRWKTLAYGGTALDDHQANEALAHVGLVEVATVPTPPGAPAITVGRRPTGA